MNEPYSIQNILALRKLTRAIADLLRGQMREYLATLAPQMRPQSVFGDYIKSANKEAVRGAEETFRELQSLYAPLAAAKLYSLPKDLKAPLEINSSGLDVTPVEYTHTVQHGADSKTVTVTSPLKWVLSYSSYPPAQLKDLLNARNRSQEELQQAVLHFLVFHLVVAKKTGVAQILEALRFPLTTVRVPAFGDLPLTHITAAIPTLLPPDSVVIESTELSGRDMFEEIVDVEGIVNLRDPLKTPLLELARSHKLLPE